MGEKEGQKTPAKEPIADGGPITVVLKLDMHCEGCAKKVKRSVKHFQGVEKVMADYETSKLTVVGNIEPAGLRERVEYKTKKKVEIISPQPKKAAAANASSGADKKPDDQKKPTNKNGEDDEKHKQPAVSTIVMKIKLHCDGCAKRTNRLIKKYIDGVNSVTTDLQKDLVTVVGTMNLKEMVSMLKEKLNGGIEIVPPKKENANAAAGVKKPGEPKKGKEPTTADAPTREDKNDQMEGGKESNGSDEKKKKGNGDGARDNGKVEVKKMEFQGNNPQTHFAMPMHYYHDYGMPFYGHHPGVPTTSYITQFTQGPPPPPPTFVDDQMFSDENPNGCFIM